MIKNYLLTVLLAVFAFSASQAQDFNPFYGNVVAQCNYDTLQSHLQTFEELGVKETGTEALTQTCQWIREQYEQYGYTEIETHTFNHYGHNLDNLIITKQGTDYPDTYLIVDAHYDTRTGAGVNDNGTGTMIVLEIARLLKDIPTKYSIRFIHFSAEEDGLVGSTAYVNQVVVPEEHELKLVYNIDEVGGVAGMVNNTIVLERDESSPTTNNEASWAYTDTLANLVDIYSNLNTTISHAWGTDYIPFQNSGYVITGLFEDNYSPYAHTANDILANLDMDYTFEVAKAALGGALYFSDAFDMNTSIDASGMEASVSVYPNPVRDFIKLEAPQGAQFGIYHVTGQLVNSGTINGNSTRIDCSGMPNGLYSIVFRNDQGICSKKVLIQH